MPDQADLVEQARNRWNAGDLPGYLDLYDDAIRLHGIGPEPLDKQAVRGFYEMLWTSLGAPDRAGPQLDFHEVLVDDDLYCCRFTMSGTHRGKFMGVPATGRAYSLPGITILRFRGDRVVERWTSADFLGLMVQLGAIPAPTG
jgi:predicted ester cyclase